MTTATEATGRTSRAGDLIQPITAGVLAALVGYASTFTLVLTGFSHVRATPAQAASGLLSVCIALGLLNTIVVWRMKIPLSFAWSTPGAAFLLTLPPIQGGYPAVLGALLITGLMIVGAGLIRPVAKAIAAIPAPIAAAMLAGVLFNLCLAPIRAVAELPMLALPILAVWVLGLKFARRYAVPLAVVAAAAVLTLTANLPPGAVTLSLPSLVFVMPVFTLDAMVKVALPLFVITMASQNLTGLAVMRASGYQVDSGPPFVLTGLASAAIAFFGGLTTNLAAITAAIAAGPESHADPTKRWPAPVAAGFTYFVLGLLATISAAFIAASPPILIQAVAGLALLPSLASALATSLADEDNRLPAIVTLVTTASGVTVLGVGGAFWGLIAGIALQLILRRWRAA